jgi:hypothetical protein
VAYFFLNDICIGAGVLGLCEGQDRKDGRSGYGVFLEIVSWHETCLAEVKCKYQDLNKVRHKWKTGMLRPCIFFESWNFINMILISWTGAPHVVTIPIQSANPMKVSTLKGSEPTLLPKTIHLASNPMVSVPLTGSFFLTLWNRNISSTLNTQ